LAEFPQRRQAVASALGTHKIEALLVSSPASVRYLTGYTGSNGLLLVTPSDSHFFTDPRYATDAKANISCVVHICKKGLYEEAAQVVKRKHLKTLGFEPSWMNVEPFDKLKKALGSTKLLPVSGIVEALRAVKSPSEIARIRAAVQANSAAFTKTMQRVRAGVREMDIAAELDFQMRMLGAEKSAFETIVASGARTALPHAHPTSKKIEGNELLLVDMGSMVDGYCSDMTRMAFLGKPDKRTSTLYKAVLEAQLAGIAAVIAGVPVSRVDGAAREVLKKHELDKAFVHSTGHGLGLEIHEGPRIAAKQTTLLQAGMVITVEPGAYIEGFGGVRIEDTVLVTEKGCEILTPTPKELMHL
jgi:Xaa-Pro aminopeptidase